MVRSYSVEIQVFPVNFITPVSWSIVDDDSEVVWVILGEDWIQIVLNSEVSVVVVTGDNDANW